MAMPAPKQAMIAHPNISRTIELPSERGKSKITMCSIFVCVCVFVRDLAMFKVTKQKN